MTKQDEFPYEDIVNLPHPSFPKHPRMSLHDRAAQFSPFAALTGFEGVIQESARLTERMVELSEEEKEELDHLMQEACMMIPKPTIKMTIFVPDEKKDGGRYETVVGKIHKVDRYNGWIILEDKRRMDINWLQRIEYSGNQEK